MQQLVMILVVMIVIHIHVIQMIGLIGIKFIIEDLLIVLI
jgi:hypothetical protein